MTKCTEGFKVSLQGQIPSVSGKQNISTAERLLVIQLSVIVICVAETEMSFTHRPIVTIRTTSVILPNLAKYAVFEVFFCLRCTITYHFGVLTCQVKSRLCIHFKTSLGRPDIFQMTVFPGQRKLPCFIKLTRRDLNVFLPFFSELLPLQ